MGLQYLIGKYDPKHVCAVWDAAHNALNGEDPEMAIDIVWSHLGMVNLKNAYWVRTTKPEAEYAKWRPFWTTGRRGLASWPRVAAELKKRSPHRVAVLCGFFFALRCGNDVWELALRYRLELIDNQPNRLRGRLAWKERQIVVMAHNLLHIERQMNKCGVCRAPCAMGKVMRQEQQSVTQIATRMDRDRGRNPVLS